MFLVLGLPRSRTFWLSRFLSYGGIACHHDHAGYLRSVEDVKSWLAQDDVGSVETAAAPWWRLARHYRPDLRLAVVRRDRREATASLVRMGVPDSPLLQALMARFDRALDSAARAPGCLSVGFHELQDEAICKRLFEHCLERPHDPAWWKALAPINLQVNLRAQYAYGQANSGQMKATAKECAAAQRYVCLKRQAAPVPDADGVVIAEESYQSFWPDAQSLIAAHCLAIGEAADAHARMNLPLWEKATRAGMVQIVTARMNGRMLGYLSALFAPSLEEKDTVIATQLAFYISPDARGLNLLTRLQRSTIERARRRGAARMYLRAGIRGSGPKLGTLYKRIGARDYGQLFELDLQRAPALEKV